ncbi:ion channel [Jannaschia rubra]|uniref:Bacterial extracellular solute-binding proteins, family 3 n=1 Tax=Jannaschia rubra TaxID=282197 RepID=A0A0M6XKM8_9RHOB|nr:transporter substrate-binding domain-containing protein [Jannaschia rubra]CTQ31649.1 Bacterial extracellular solute-binding proteins, family 3 [Jannaschia rubra]SFF75700.1 amino acid ABC transporter substrate-binding protein, PAAT family [Jannaschia rubra]
MNSIRLLAAFALAFLTLALPIRAIGQEVSVGVMQAPPFALTDGEGLNTGLTVDLFRLAAEAADIEYTFVALPAGTDPVDALARHDIVLPVEGSAEIESRADLSQPFYTATLGMAAPEDPMVLRVVKGFVTLDFLRIVAGVAALLFVVGAIVWAFERRTNEEMFHKAPSRGLGDGFWWAGVTLTTIGYGDKAPVTTMGRAIAMIWMLVGLAVSASLTAAVVTLASGDGQSIDLPEAVLEKRVAVPVDGSAEAFLKGRGVIAAVVPDPSAALAEIAADRADVVVAAAPLLHWANERDGQSLRITTTRWDPVLIAMAFNEGDPLRERMDRALLTVIASETGQEVVRRWIPEDF